MSTAHPHAQLQQCSGLQSHHPPSQRKQNKRNNCSPGLQKNYRKDSIGACNIIWQQTMLLRNAYGRKRAH